MINLIKCIKLISVRPNKTQVEFLKDKVPEGDAELQLTITNDFSIEDSENASRCKVTFSAEARGALSGEEAFTSLEFDIDYIFEIVDKQNFSALTEEDAACLCSNIVYMDYRRRLLVIMSTASMNGIKLPLSLQDLTS